MNRSSLRRRLDMKIRGWPWRPGGPFLLLTAVVASACGDGPTGLVDPEVEVRPTEGGYNGPVSPDNKVVEYEMEVFFGSAETNGTDYKYWVE